MIRLGPITIMRSDTADAYSDVTKAAWAVHQMIWFYGENNVWPDELRSLDYLDDALAEALSYAPVEDIPE